MRTEKLTFVGAGGEHLAARLDLPLEGTPIAYALFAHCFTCGKNLAALSHIGRELTRVGIGVLRFDFTGLGESEGDFADTHFSSNVADLIAAAHFLEQNYTAPQILIGHSLGGAAVLKAAGALPSVKAVATIGAPAEAKHVLRLLGDARADLSRSGEVQVQLAGRSFRIKQAFVDDLEASSLADSIKQLRRALLIFHSPVDAIVDIDNAARIFQTALHPKSFVSLDRADHLLSAADDARYVGAVMAGWVRKYVGAPTYQPRYAGDNRTVARIGGNRYQTEVISNGHALLADEPLAVGGGNTGPSPYDLLLAALGACTAMTLRMYADRKNWPIDEITVRLEHRKIHAADCAECATEVGMIDEIRKEIEVVGALDEEQRARLLEIADRCPVHRTLHSEIRVLSQIVNELNQETK